jgi:translation elongation factor EF-1alpha
MKKISYPRIVVTGEVNSGKSTLIGRFLLEAGALSAGAVGELEETRRRLGRAFETAYLLDSFEKKGTESFVIDTTQVFCRIKEETEFIHRFPATASCLKICSAAASPMRR